jgi:hypothetical protein
MFIATYEGICIGFDISPKGLVLHEFGRSPRDYLVSEIQSEDPELSRLIEAAKNYFGEKI